MKRKLIALLTATMLMVTMLTLSAASVSAYTGNSSKDRTAGTDIRVMSYNTLVDNDEANGGWSWGKPIGDRPEKAAAAILYYLPDVIGLQENNYNWHVGLRAALPNYDYVNADVPEVQKLEASASLGKKDWMCTTMMYNTDTLELVENELIGYSVNYWGCIQRMRYISMALFRVKATGRLFVFTSTHFDAEKDTKGQKMRKTQATELAERLAYYQETYGCPVVSTGDYNSGYTAEPLTIVRETAGMTSHANNRGGIDYILYSEGITADYFTVVNDSDLAGASDHHPIFADMSFDCDHQYDNACDADCNVCNKVREVAGHVYDDYRDVECNECGALRDPVTLGDLNGDGVINNRDLGLFQQYLADWKVTPILDAADINQDGRINNRDMGVLIQYLADWDTILG